MAKKKFLEVFQQIKLNPKTEDYFSDVYVTNVIYWKNSKMQSERSIPVLQAFPLWITGSVAAWSTGMNRWHC